MRSPRASDAMRVLLRPENGAGRRDHGRDRSLYFRAGRFLCNAQGSRFRPWPLFLRIEGQRGECGQRAWRRHGREERSGIVPGVALLLRSRAMWVFIAGMVMFQLANAPMLPLVATELTKTSATWAVPLIGACIVLPQIIVALFAPWVGRLAQRIGRRPLLVAALAVLPIRGVLLAFFNGAFPVVSIQILDGVSAAVLGVLIPARRRRHLIRHRTFQSRAGRDRNVDRARRRDQHARRGLRRRHVRAAMPPF